MTRIGLFPGSFDPPTLGHLDLVRRGLHVVDKLVIGVGINVDKTPWLTAEQRVELLSALVPEGVEVMAFSRLAVDAARKVGASVLVRGVRGASDLAVESQMALANRLLAPELETLLLVTSTEVAHISGRLVREVHSAGGDVGVFVPPSVAAALARL